MATCSFIILAPVLFEICVLFPKLLRSLAALVPQFLEESVHQQQDALLKQSTRVLLGLAPILSLLSCGRNIDEDRRQHSDWGLSGCGDGENAGACIACCLRGM